MVGNEAEELQRASDRNDIKDIYNGLKEVCGPQTKQPVHLKSFDGLEIFTDSKRVMARWSEYFQKLLNVPGGHRTRGAGKHTKVQCQYCSG